MKCQISSLCSNKNTPNLWFGVLKLSKNSVFEQPLD